MAKTCLIIGANRGIGFQLATRFLAKGYHVFGTYRPETRDDPSVATLKGTGVQTIEASFTDEESIKSAAKEFGDGPLDVLINVGGLYKLWDDTPFTKISGDDVLEHFKVNTLGPFLTSKAFLPVLQKSSQGKIITVSSDFASIADNTGGNICYRISKAGVNQLTKNMAADLAKQGITNVLPLAVHPGYVATKMTGFYGEDDMETCMSALVDTIERFGRPEGKDIPVGGYVKWDGTVMAY